MQGFNIQTRDINQLINKIEKEINQIASNLSRNVQTLSSRLDANTKELALIKEMISELKDYTQDYELAERRISELNARISEIRDKLNQLCSTVSLDEMSEQAGWIWQPGDD